VLLNGFYEWKLEGKQKQPYYVYLKQQHQQAGDTRLPASEKGSGLTPGERLMPIAGLWDVAHGEILQLCSW
jgi:putative SOS response-associated peptidase YedK